ncbi:hypothetical protein K435DRAFT_809011 [Dendrothele bispora CBS 962.96]|uniref:Uncharacterized protein n=1 Tax=Dendrothele bispora (strain CBS 962.96) TaxID=1314807 RepID=A0A4S8KZZ3_DENBC|nr:hypothetical protein K435DRAFT_809011 [Dendrothele bispora CBS 962.96]
MYQNKEDEDTMDCQTKFQIFLTPENFLERTPLARIDRDNGFVTGGTTEKNTEPIGHRMNSAPEIFSFVANCASVNQPEAVTNLVFVQARLIGYLGSSDGISIFGSEVGTRKRWGSNKVETDGLDEQGVRIGEMEHMTVNTELQKVSEKLRSWYFGTCLDSLPPP